MAEKKLSKKEPRATEHRLADAGVKGIVELTKDALGKAPAWMRGIIYVSGIGVVLCMVVAVLFIFTAEPERGFQTFRYGIGLLGVALLALVFSLRNKNESEAIAPAEPDLPGQIWSHFRRQILASNSPDFLIYSFVCPKVEPTSVSELTKFSVYSLWADPRGGTITVQLESADPPHLDIQFLNSDKGWPGDLAIRPGGLHPYKRDKGKNFLSLDARIPQSESAESLQKISLRFRVVDRLCTDWYHGQGENDYSTECVEAKDGWKTISVSLNDGQWKVFGSDRNHHYPGQQPDFDEMILAIVIEMGSDRGNERPGPGKGRLQIRNIRFSER